MANQDTDQIFREVDEELRKERFEQLWKDYSTFVVAAALAIVLGVGGWKLYEYTQAKRVAEAGARFNSALLLLESKKTDEAEKILRGLSADGTIGYRTLARMRLAAAEQASGRPDAAVQAYDAIVSEGKADPLLRGLASLKAAMLRSDSADWTEMQNRLTPLKEAKNPWSLSARELLGLAAWKAGKLAEAEAEYQALIGERNLPQAMRQRVETMLALLLDTTKAPAGGTPEPAAAVPATTASDAATAPPQGAAKDQAPAVPKARSPAPPATKAGGAKGAQK